MSEENGGRRIVRTRSEPFGEYDLEDDPQPDIGFLPLSYDRATGRGSYAMRMGPGTVTQAHTHRLREEYLIVEGRLIEDDGTVLGPGDYVIYEPGTRHCSRTEEGCLLVAIDWPAHD